MINREQFVRWWKDFDPHENYYTQEKSCAWASWQASAELSAEWIAELEHALVSEAVNKQEFKDRQDKITALEARNKELRELLERALDDCIEVLNSQFELLPYKQTRYDNQERFVEEIKQALANQPVGEVK
jgi:DNA-binding GntR family transcriptional regulator